MKSSKKLLECCASICEGDGISPRHEKNKENHVVYDSRRLCSQIKKLSRLAIAELGLADWDVIEVKQKPKKASLLLVVEPTIPASTEECEVAIKWLKANQGQIRSIVANGINRKAAPALHFKLADESDYSDEYYSDEYLEDQSEYSAKYSAAYSDYFGEVSDHE
jgi:hypothetical protein